MTISRKKKRLHQGVFGILKKIKKGKRHGWSWVDLLNEGCGKTKGTDPEPDFDCDGAGALVVLPDWDEL
jgi:hypothetical protein